MSNTYAFLTVLGFVGAAVATVSSMALRGRPTEWRWRVRQLSRFGIVCGCIGGVMRITHGHHPVVVTGDQALLALSLGVMMMARAHSEIRRHFIEQKTPAAEQGPR